MQLQQLQKKISVMKNELQLIDRMLNRRNESVIPRHQMTTCTNSRQFSRRESNIVLEVCGFPVYQNPFDQLSNFESHTEGQTSEIPVEVEESDEEVIPLIDPRKRRTQQLQSETVNSVAEPVISIQNVKDSMHMASAQYMTEQATELKNCVQDQAEMQISKQTMQGKSSTK